MALIPGLPDELARHCLVRIHCTQVSTMSSVSKAWNSELRSRQFRLMRKQLFNGNHLILFKCRSDSHRINKLILLELRTSLWSELPPIPDFPNGLSDNTLNFKIASFKCGFVVIGDHKVYVFDYLSATWQRGTDMRRGEVYGCTSNRDRKVYVLSSGDYYSGCVLKVYDVMKDEWSHEINMREDEDITDASEYNMIYQSGKIYFIDVSTLGLGRLNSFNKRVLNVSTWEWEQPHLNFLESHSYYISVSEDGEWYSFRHSGNIEIYKDFTWKNILEMEELNYFRCVAMWKSKALFLCPVPKRGDIVSSMRVDLMAKKTSMQVQVRILDLKTHQITTISSGPKELRVGIEAFCYLEI